MSLHDPLGLDDSASQDDGTLQSSDRITVSSFGGDGAFDTGLPDLDDTGVVDPATGEPTVDAGPEPSDGGLPGFDDVDPASVDFPLVDPASVIVDPAAVVVGEPAEDAEYWLYQGDGQGTCAPTAVAMVIADVLDDPLVTNEVVLQRALELGLITHDPAADGDAGTDSAGDWSGIDNTGMMVLCEEFGLDVSSSFGDTNQLIDSLDSGRAVMVGLDAHEIWYGEDDAGDQGYDDNHAVVVTGIDLTNGLVYLNDPGTPEGRGAVVPLAQFEDAWADAANQMIFTDVTEDQAAATVDLGGAPVEVPSGTGPEVYPDAAGAGLAAAPADRPSLVPEDATGLVVLPFTFVPQVADVVSADQRGTSEPDRRGAGGFDANADGIPDPTLMDMTGEGLDDSVGLDSDQNGIFEVFATDLNHDSMIEAVAIDQDQNGVPEVFMADQNRDGSLETTAVDPNQDGVLDSASSLYGTYGNPNGPAGGIEVTANPDGSSNINIGPADSGLSPAGGYGPPLGFGTPVGPGASEPYDYSSYDRDSDGDRIPDARDPQPTAPYASQSMDQDGDRIPDASDHNPTSYGS
ncbi:Peptidase_C39 like family protein [Geodermatophilus pulveris]|uniref:Peptidase_C39 like family protein n=1 Tax=Geodermatophilus pulveris TaxID=1564159 RepID=A0A239GMA3_9ACTN|nr:C39 family peptidase [Geodermatophilus pulveris]SNS69184.1 Peptidase_C39 like family protein [Geodermatophilus pulveris]